uniref:Bri3 binding protein n=1 Tax=Oryzias latipes TaxID=8090 RepID=A0A3P9MIQ8_ORYLA
MKGIRLFVVFSVLFAFVLCSAEAGRSRTSTNSFRRVANGIYQTLSSVFGEDNIRGLHKFFSKATERFVHGVDSFLETIWKIWSDLLDVMGIDCKPSNNKSTFLMSSTFKQSEIYHRKWVMPGNNLIILYFSFPLASNLSHYFSVTSLTNFPARALLLVAAVLVAYWFLSMFLGGFFYLLHAIFGRFFWLARVTLFALSCLYILQKFEGDPERAVLPLCFIMAVYFMTGPVGAYWRRGGGAGSLEEKIDHLDTQVRLLNIRLSRVMDSMERSGEQ